VVAAHAAIERRADRESPLVDTDDHGTRLDRRVRRL
jgi:hypothetical protein